MITEIEIQSCISSLEDARILLQKAWDEIEGLNGEVCDHEVRNGNLKDDIVDLKSEIETLEDKIRELEERK